MVYLQNGDGFISAKELGVLMRAMGRNPTEDEIMQIMNEIDIDHNGKYQKISLFILISYNWNLVLVYFKEDLKYQSVTYILIAGKLDFSEFTIMMREKLQGEDMEEEIRQAFR